MTFYLNGAEIDGLSLNGVEIDTAYLNGIEVFSSYTKTHTLTVASLGGGNYGYDPSIGGGLVPLTLGPANITKWLFNTNTVMTLEFTPSYSIDKLDLVAIEGYSGTLPILLSRNAPTTFTTSNSTLINFIQSKVGQSIRLYMTGYLA